MKRIFIALAAVMFLATTSCQKEEINPSTTNPKNKLIECNRCEGGWDLTDTIPANP